MFAFISFFFKLIFASFFGGIIYYKDNSKNNTIFIYSILVCIFSAALMDLAQQFPSESLGFISGICIVSILISLNSLLKDLKIEDKITLLFVALIGIIIGSGFIFHAVLLTALIYFIKEHNNTILEYMNNDNDNENKHI